MSDRKNKKNKKILAFGTFDVFHRGHESFLKQAKKTAKNGILNVVVARDSTVREHKKIKPKHNENQRLKYVKNDPNVNYAFLGNKTRRMDVIRRIKPDIICLGYDQKLFIDALESYLKRKKLNNKIKIIRLKPHKAHKYKSSKIREKW